MSRGWHPIRSRRSSPRTRHSGKGVGFSLPPVPIRGSCEAGNCDMISLRTKAVIFVSKESFLTPLGRSLAAPAKGDYRLLSDSAFRPTKAVELPHVSRPTVLGLCVSDAAGNWSPPTWLIVQPAAQGPRLMSAPV